MSAGPVPQFALLPRGIVYWFLVSLYAVAAFGPVPMYFLARRLGWFAKEPPPVNLLLEQYVGIVSVYRVGSAACTYLLLRRNQRAVAAAVIVAAGVALLQLANLPGWAAEAYPDPYFKLGCALMVLFGFAAYQVARLARRGVFR